MDLDTQIENPVMPNGEDHSVRACSGFRVDQDKAIESTTETNQDRFVVFEAAGQLAAFPVSGIREIERVPAYTALPFTPRWCLGVTNIRDEMVSVTDLATLIGAPRSETANDPKIIMLFGKQSQAITAVVVDRVIGIRNLRSPFPAIPVDCDSAFVAIADHVYQAGGDVMFLIDPERFFAHPEMQPFMQSDRQTIHSNDQRALAC